MIRTAIHMILHISLPAVTAFLLFRNKFLKAFLIMSTALLIDLDHLAATPVFDPWRCSIGFHPLHTGWAIALYMAALFISPLRIAGAGLLLHILSDLSDCIIMGWLR